MLRGLKLKQFHNIELKTTKSRFVENLKHNVDKEKISFNNSILEFFSQGYSKYKGEVGHKGFKIKKRNRLFNIGRHMAVASGTYHQKGNELVVSTEINGFQGGMKLYYGFLTMFYLIYFIPMILTNSQLEQGFIFTIAIIILQMIFLFGMPYLIMRRSISYLKNELSNDLARLG